MTDEQDAPPMVPTSDAERAADLERRLNELEASTNARLVRAELKAVAVRAGMVDLDGLKLIDVDKLTLDDDGSVKGAGEVMRDLRRAKPWLFGGASTSSSSPAPPVQPTRPRLATEMSYDEWQAARTEMLRRA